MKISDIASRDLSHLDRDTLKNTLSSPTTMVVRAGDSALKVAKMADTKKPGLIVIVGSSNAVRGVVSPDWVLKQFASRRKRKFATLYSALKDLESDPNEVIREFHHEWLNGRISLFYCATGNHYTSRSPCPIH
jgi:hypothetical protein